jgi:hypothetical protein
MAFLIPLSASWKKPMCIFTLLGPWQIKKAGLYDFNVFPWSRFVYDLDNDQAYGESPFCLGSPDVNMNQSQLPTQVQTQPQTLVQQGGALLNPG